MATSYYICNIHAKNEYAEIKKFWENEFAPMVKRLFSEECEKIAGHYINRDFAEDILIPGGEIISSYCPYMEIPTESEIGQFSYVNQRFDYCLITGEIQIRSKTELERFIAENPEFIMYDEYNEDLSLKEFFEKTLQV